MSEPKFHHYVTQSHLKNFQGSENCLYYFDSRKPNVPVKHRNTKSIFCKKWDNTAVDKFGKKDFSLETAHYGELDNAAPVLFSKLIEACSKKSVPKLTSDDRRTLSRIFYNQFKRSPDVKQGQSIMQCIDETWSTSVERIRDKFPATEISELEIPETRKRIIQEATVEAGKQETPEMLEMLDGLSLRISRIADPKNAFIVGSKPVWSDLDDGGQLSFWLPVSSEVIVGLDHADAHETFTEINDGNAIRKMNERVAGQSTEIAGRSKELVESLKRFCKPNF
jgi:hypothetical protein